MQPQALAIIPVQQVHLTWEYTQLQGKVARLNAGKGSDKGLCIIRTQATIPVAVTWCDGSHNKHITSILHSTGCQFCPAIIFGSM